MIISNGHVAIAREINDRIIELERSGGDELEIYLDMKELMFDFSYLVNTVGDFGINELCSRFIGFHRYVQVLENIAMGVEAGDIKVPGMLV
jgi:hypothetical protein